MQIHQIKVVLLNTTIVLPLSHSHHPQILTRTATPHTEEVSSTIRHQVLRQLVTHLTHLQVTLLSKEDLSIVTSVSGH